MIFQRISYQIAIQFMALVFLLLLITGIVFLGISFADRQQHIQQHLSQTRDRITSRFTIVDDLPRSLPPFQRDRIRIVDTQHKTVFGGNLYEAIPFETGSTIRSVTVDDESYDILTSRLLANGQLAGYIQVADRSPPNDLEWQAILFLLVSGSISFLTFGVGLVFARRSLRPAEQMLERLEQFTQDASHELRTPITAISTSLDLALATDDFRDNVLSAKKDLKEVALLIERLLELARLDNLSLEKEEVDLSSLVTQSIQKFQTFADEKKIVIAADITPDIRVNGDPTLLRQVVANLLMNAIKFNPEGGRIEVTLTSHLLSIHDTGCGISATALPHVFDRFYQEDTARTKGKQGLGLGLALVKRIVDLHSWTIDVASVPGEGTTFTMHVSHR